MIETVEHRFRSQLNYLARNVQLSAEHRELAATVEPHLIPYFLHPPRGQMFVPPLGRCETPKAIARVDHGRWLADCPMRDCCSAQHVSKEDPWFFCANCTNAEVGCKSIPVVWPKEHEEIEQMLLRRPFVPTRNWQPPLSVKDLDEENKRYLELS